MPNIENQNLTVTINAKGAELESIYHKGHQLEYMWGGDPNVWGKHSPLLFPIVGTLRQNTWNYKGKTWTLPRHGFAREMEFGVEQQTKDGITLLLKSNDATRAKYPFDFELRVIYQLAPNGLATTYSVKNTSAGEMYFSIGGHPAFRVPLAERTTYTDYYLEFEQKETANRWPISKEGLIETAPQPVLDNTNILPITRDLFSTDALVFKNLASTTVSLKSRRTRHGLDFDFTDFPYLGIWAAKNEKADFVCIEPWCGISDSVDSDQQMEDKEGIQQLAPGETFERIWAVKLY
jgi:galactose mutarotase-like enzyme